ncbi:hypothetical protein NEPAR06_1584 [Nematocida parisii]|uniref:uncharacterized protein n=1 Tax=Nematocida parisii (strain ERTm1 / ATCC PRA-289) TaxID=881290 RepID=UPI000264B5E1|nr:uncharacterized protein NEPG_00311 [Nematocida parisii ERTm1]EIJ94787.1 hypothetical protein NEPG_00311 [Nematocida parisii ERTm1]KAI5145277.1 hypothetical protein NEPAR07_1585 [Nematocida parisii]KAI5155145.1 hypothetical protein NEPAR06_1584 [Nematocida parisii]|eukprot:XP_013058143.1 hypothetical protein NEPG_00311 [Nematocida parisii ERTm1]
MHYTGALIAVDTNILMGKLQIIRHLSFLIEDVNISFFIPCTVIRELDALKVHNPSARAAILFLEQENARENCKIFIEPAIIEKGDTNDDSIVISCKNNKILLLLSDDTALRLKANNANFGMHSMSVENKTASALYTEIINFFQISFMECEMKDDHVGTIKKNTACVASAVYYKKVLPIMKRELGEDMLQFYLPPGLDQSLSSLLKYVAKNHHLFTGYLSKSSISIISQFASKKVDEDDLRTILDIFSVSFP